MTRRKSVFMARRKQKFTFVHLCVMAALMIWLPAAIGRLAGVPGEPLADPPAGMQSPQPIDVDAVSHVQQRETDTGVSSAFRPAPAGLVLTETLISASGKTAVINGLAFREGQFLHQTGYPLRLRSILAGKVVLEGDGGLYELQRRSPFE